MRNPFDALAPRTGLAASLAGRRALALATITACSEEHAPLDDFEFREALFGVTVADEPETGAVGLWILLYPGSAVMACEDLKDDDRIVGRPLVSAWLTGLEAGTYAISSPFEDDYPGDVKRALVKHEIPRPGKKGAFDYLMLGGHIDIPRGVSFDELTRSSPELEATLVLDTSVDPNGIGTCEASGGPVGDNSRRCHCETLEGVESTCTPTDPSDPDCCDEAAGAPYERYRLHVRAQFCPSACSAATVPLLSYCEALLHPRDR